MFVFCSIVYLIMPADVSVHCDVVYEYVKVVASGSKVITATNPFTTYKV